VDYKPHIQLIRALRPLCNKRYNPKRWVVERTLACPSKCRVFPTRWAKKACNYLDLLKFASTLIWFRRYHCLVL
jgi:transposase